VEGVLVAAGVAIVIVALYLLLGNDPFHPRRERYSLVLLAPLLWLGAQQATAWLPPRRALGACVALGVVWLIGFQLNYFGWLARHNSTGEFAFATAAVEPKLAAYRTIEGDLGPTTSAIVCAQDWWVEKPLEFLAAREPRLRVLPETAFPAVAAGRARADRLYVAVFGDRPLFAPLADYVDSHAERAWQVADEHGRLLITVYRCPPPAAGPGQRE
jgi:hypothetical protein